MKRRFNRRQNGRAPTPVNWSDVSQAFAFVAVTSTSQAILISLESPTSLTNLGADPPEDLTVLRVVGDYQVVSSTSSHWRLGLLVQDRTWTANASGIDDNDKRVLWSQSYHNSLGAVTTWAPPGYMLTALSPVQIAGQPREAVHLDIAPRVRIEPGKALYLVAWEEQSGASLTVTSFNMRVLYKRSGRR